MSDGSFNEPPCTHSGAIQLWLPTITPPFCLARHQLSHKKDQNQSTDFPLTSMSTSSWKRSPFSIRYNNITLFLMGMYCFQVSVHNLKQAGNEPCRGKCHVAADCHIEPRWMHGYWIYAQFAVDHCPDVTEGGLQNFCSSYMMNGLSSNIFAPRHSNVLMRLI